MMDYGNNHFNEFEKQYKKAVQTIMKKYKKAVQTIMKKEKKEVVCIRLPESIKKKVDAEAKKMYLAPSKLVAVIVEQYYQTK